MKMLSPKSPIRKTVARLKTEIVFLYQRWKTRNLLRAGAKLSGGEDRGPGLESGTPVPPPRFPPSLLAAAGFGDAREQAFYGRTAR